MKVLLSREAVHTGNLILVNREYGYRQQSSRLSVLGESAADFYLEEPAVGALERLMSEIGGWDRIVPVSAWRSQEKQQEIWNQSLDNVEGFILTEWRHFNGK